MQTIKGLCTLYLPSGYAWAILVLLVVANTAQAKIRVVVSIKPVHSLVAAVMEGVGTPALLMDATASPHSYYLRPSQAKTLATAQVVVWIGPLLESFLKKPLSVLAPEARIVEVISIPELHRLQFRRTASFQDHDYNQHHEHQSNEHDVDPHVWLDPTNARIIADAVTGTLVELDPANADRYRTNNRSLSMRLSMLATTITALLQPLRNRPFVVLHDAYQYFEHRFGLTAVGAVMINPEVLPGAARIRQIQHTIKQLHVVCVFSEPQLESTYVNLVTAGTAIKIGRLDPLAIGIETGPRLYFDLIHAMAVSIRDCLSDDG